MNAGMNMSAVLLGVLTVTGMGVGGAWLVKARTSLLAWNWHMAAAVLGALLALSVWDGLGQDGERGSNHDGPGALRPGAGAGPRSERRQAAAGGSQRAGERGEEALRCLRSDGRGK